MTTVVQIACIAVSALGVIAGLIGVAELRLPANPSRGRAFWLLVRITQASALVLMLLAGAVLISGKRPENWLFWLYMLLPATISLIAEQLRIASADQVLQKQGLDGADEVKDLDEIEQRSIVQAVLARETALMTTAVLTIAFLAVRALSERGGL